MDTIMDHKSKEQTLSVLDAALDIFSYNAPRMANVRALIENPKNFDCDTEFSRDEFDSALAYLSQNNVRFAEFSGQRPAIVIDGDRIMMVCTDFRNVATGEIIVPFGVLAYGFSQYLYSKNSKAARLYLMECLKFAAEVVKFEQNNISHPGQPKNIQKMVKLCERWNFLFERFLPGCSSSTIRMDRHSMH